MDFITAYFENGLLINISPSNACNQYQARYLVSDGLLFDIESADGINSIPIPNFKQLHGFPNISHSLDYVLKRKAGDLSQKGMFDLSIICLRKANQFMSHSPIHWSRKDYFYIVSELVRAGRLDEAIKEKKYIEEHYIENYDSKTLHIRTVRDLLIDAKSLGTDLLEADNPPNCSELCAKYRKRIYSLSGNDFRFPTMTDEILNCGLMFFPFIDGISKPKYCSSDEIITFNNRPFFDDRTVEERENYQKFTKQRILEDRRADDFLEYQQIRHILSEFCPKSLKAYQEMKFNNTDNFQELMQIAEEERIDIELYT